MVCVRVLGSIEFETDGESGEGPHSIARAPRVRRLLAILLTRANSVASVDWIADALWPTRPNDSAGSAIQNLVSRLRASLRSSAGHQISLVTRPRGYCLQIGRADLDAWVFEDLFARGRAAMGSSPDCAAELLDQALGWWGGPCL